MWLATLWAVLKAGVLSAIAGRLGLLGQRAPHRVSLGAVLGTALVLRAAWMVAIPVAPTGDALAYHTCAVNLASGRGYTLDGSPTARVPPSVVFVLAAFYRAFGPNALWGQLLNLGLSLALVYLTYRLTEKVAGQAAGLTAALLLAVWPSHFAFSGQLLADPLFVSSFLAALVVTSGGTSDRLHGRAVTVGALLALTILTKGLGVFALPVWFVWASSLLPGRTVRPFCVTALLVAGSLCSLWTLRNYFVFHALVPVGTYGGMTLWQGNRPGSTGLPHDAAAIPFPDEHDEVARDRLAFRAAVAYISEDPAAAVTRFGEKVYRIYERDDETAEVAFLATDRSIPPIWRTLFARACSSYFNAVMLLFWCAAIFFALPGQGPASWYWRLLVAPVLGFWALHAVFVAQYRYSYLTSPFVAIGVAVASQWLLRGRGRGANGGKGTPTASLTAPPECQE
jgi:hypothetical protein